MTYTAYGEPQSLSLTEQPTPKLAPGAVLIKVERAAVNPVDWKLMAGGLDEMLDVVFPVIPGWDAAGVVEAVGPDVPEFAPGDRVATYARKDFVHGGTYAEYVAVPATSAAHIPDDVDTDSAAGLPLAGLTALRTLESLNLTAEDTLLIHAASGGVGHLATQLAADVGAEVIGTASEQNHQKLRDLGATPVSYGEGLPERIRQLAPDGVTAVADFAGGVVDQTLEVLAEAGRHASIADPSVLQHGGQLIWVRPDGPRLETLLQRISEGKLKVSVDTVYPLEQAAQAMQHNIEGSSGKVLIDVTR
ncbi:NADP-dependent oxidoreductase [Nesterenkonia sp.]|uniref:NADP-dependent oxidoreductase n=1 Tax=Nesterenkonia sp. TaxID=704201 RepID=UPI003454A741